ncbi:radical SAM protein [Methanosalsum natronophilum]|uniref:Radical SAM protein n=1 Tax=Methanosalsum natronophilum TaxID=768733 RepID=A0A424Z2V9_9EURY|nr:MAG: radical SAM protein [Methanosalsum natronophilum]
MTNITLINPNVNPDYGTLAYYPPLGLLYIASVLRKNGHNVHFIDADNLGLDDSDIIERIKTSNSTIIGITCLTAQLSEVYELSRHLKQHDQDLKIIVGGAHPSAEPFDVLNDCKYIDIVIIGEGEYTFLELVQRIELEQEYQDVHGIASRIDGTIIISNPRILMHNIDEIPIPAYDLIESFLYYPGTYPTKHYPSMYVMGSRGCPFKCSFCSDSIWKGTLRKRDPIKIVDEVELLITKYGIKEIFFQDDTFNIDTAWLKTICHNIIKRNLHTKCSFKCPMRANKNLINDDIFSLLKKANFWMVFFGVESGSQSVLNGVSKGLIKREIERAFKIAKKWEVKTYASFMIGNYPEQNGTIFETIEFAKKIDPDFFGIALLIPYPGTPAYSQLIHEKRIIRSFQDYRIGEELFIHPNIPEGGMKRGIELFNTEMALFKSIEEKSIECTIVNRIKHYLRDTLSKQNPDLNRIVTHLQPINNSLYAQTMLPISKPDISIEIDTNNIREIKAGELFYVEIYITNNCGEVLKSYPPNPVLVSYHWRDKRGEYVIFNGLRTVIKPMILPNNKIKIKVKILAPEASGDYYLEITCVQEGVFWFEERCKNLPIIIEFYVKI